MTSTASARRVPGPARALGLAALFVAALAACTSQPSNRRIISDIIQTQGSLPEDQQACMLNVLDGYDDATLDKIASDNQNYDTPAELAENGSPEYQQYVADLSACTGVTAGSDVSASVPSSTEP